MAQVATPPTRARRDAPTVLAVSARGLTRKFDDVPAVTGVDLEVPAGTILGIVGPSGSGKTTTIRMLIGTLAPTAGALQVLGEMPSQFRRATRERIGYMPQHSILYPDLTVAENVDFMASLFGLLLFRRRSRKRKVLELMDLWQVRGRRVGKLSGGMQRRLSLACALVHEPALLVLDEPTAGIDPILRRTVWDELHRLRDAGVTILATTQYVTEAEECDEVALIAHGRVLAFGTPDALRRQAIGGEELELTTDQPFDATVLASLPSVRHVQQTGLRDFRVIVDDAGQATPEVVDAVAKAGAEVGSVREYRPSFEDVFTRLVEHPPENAPNGQPAGAVPTETAPDGGPIQTAPQLPVDAEPTADAEPAADAEPGPEALPEDSGVEAPPVESRPEDTEAPR
jgi:ABC-2 type transport system ATP-binding protein